MCSRSHHNAIAIVIAFALSLPAFGQDKESEARAALALAKAKREREQSKAKADAVAVACHTDYTAAVAEATREKKPLVVWAGVKCADYPELRKALAGGVHCHIAADRHKHGEAIVIQGGDGTEWFIRPANLKKPDIADKIKAKWAEPFNPPPLRFDVVVSEELSYVYPPYPPTIYGSVYTVQTPRGPAPMLSGG